MRFAYIIERPFNYVDANGAVVGCDVDLARALNAALALDVFEPKETTFQDLLPGLAAGRWDMTTGMFATPERCKHAWFSRPIWALTDGFLVPASNPLGLSGYTSLAAHPTARLAVLHAQVQHDRALVAGIARDRITLFSDYSEAALAVEQGMVDAYASVASAHRGYLDGHCQGVLDVIDVPVDQAPASFGAFAVSLTATDLQHRVDAFLSSYIGSKAHMDLMTRYGFSEDVADLVRP